MLAGLMCAGAGGAFAADRVDGIVVRFFDENPVAASGSLGVTAQRELESALGVPLQPSGRTQDGAYRFGFATPLSVPDARRAINRLRSTGAVLYAEFDEGDARRAAQKALASTDTTPVRRIIVRYRNGTNGAAALPSTEKVARAGQAARQPVDVERAIGGGHVTMKLSRPVARAEAERIVATLGADPDVEYAEVDRVARPATNATDPMFGSQWNLTDPAGGIDAPPAWDLTTGVAGVRIAVVDSGKLPHPDLAGRYVGGYDFVSDPAFANDGDGRDADPTDPGDWVTSAEIAAPDSVYQTCTATPSSWHGTQVASVLAAVANNGAGFAGVVWNNPVVPVRVMGKCGATLSDIADGIRWAAGVSVPGAPANAYPARVISVSLIGSGVCGSTLQSAINAAVNAGAIVVAAAGNEGEDVSNHWPANCNGVVAVGGTNRSGGRASFSNVGAKISLMAPAGGNGSTVTTALNGSSTSADPNGYTYWQTTGTSLSAPQVAGVAALILSRDPSLTAADVVAMLESHARPFPTGTGADCNATICGAGILDAAASVRAAQPVSAVTAQNGIAVYRRSSATFFIDFQADRIADLRLPLGVPTDRPVAGRFGPDGRTGVAVYRNGMWYIDADNDGSVDVAMAFGGASNDIPLAAPFSDPTRDDLVIYRAGIWYVDNASTRDGRADRVFRFGGDPSDVPLAGDVDGDGIADLIVYRRGLWYIDLNRDGVADRVVGFGGASQDIPALVDWNGDGRMDLVIFRDGMWYVTTDLSGNVAASFAYGQAGDVPVIGGRYR